MTKRAIIYARVSIGQQTSGFSIPLQLRACRAYALEKGCSVFKEVTDVCSGATLDRPGLPEVRSLVALGAADVVVAHEMDRLARRLALQLVLEGEFAQRGVPIEYVLEQYDDSPEGQLMRQVRAIVSEYERAKVRQRTRSGNRARARAGYVRIGHSPPYGYRYISGDKKGWLEVVEQEARIVRMVFEWAAQGDETGKPLGAWTIRSKLSERRIPTKSEIEGYPIREPGIWSLATVRRLLRNEVYAGVWHYGQTGTTSDGRTELRPREEWIPVPVPPIVGRELWEAVQEQLRQNSLRWSRNTRHEYLLRGRLVCEACGSTFRCRTATSKGEKRGYYYCAGQRLRPSRQCKTKTCRGCVRQDAADRRIWDRVEHALKKPDLIREGIRQHRRREQQALETLQTQLASVTERLRSLDELRSGHLDCYLKDESMTRDTLRVKMGTIAEARGRLTAEAEALRGELDATPQSTSKTGADQISAYCEQTARVIDTLTFEDRRRVLERLDIRGVVRRGEKPRERLIFVTGCIPESEVRLEK